MEIDIIRMSSRGQIVIPASMRKHMAEGARLLVIKEGDMVIITPLDSLKPAVKEDILFAEMTEQALLECKKGKVSRRSESEFRDELASW